MRWLETDFATVPVQDDSYDMLQSGGILHGELLKELETIFKYHPVIESVSVVDGRIGLWGDGEARKFIRIKFMADYATATETLAP